MRSRTSRLALSTFAWTLVLAPTALAQEGAHDNGEGFLGELDDKVVTYFSLGVILFFVLVIVVGTLIQQRLDRRKDEKKAERIRQRIGW
jgi:nitrogen fixation/metabolism regulation signal transduction histidine kinase